LKPTIDTFTCTNTERESTDDPNQSTAKSSPNRPLSASPSLITGKLKLIDSLQMSSLLPSISQKNGISIMKPLSNNNKSSKVNVFQSTKILKNESEKFKPSVVGVSVPSLNKQSKDLKIAINDSLIKPENDGITSKMPVLGAKPSIVSRSPRSVRNIVIPKANKS
jgi:hypothetical protein